MISSTFLHLYMANELIMITIVENNNYFSKFFFSIPLLSKNNRV